MSTRLDELLSREEYARFLDAIRDTAKCFPDIIGVLGVGSLVHSSEIPDDFFTLRYNTARGLAYERIRNPGRRRLAIREESDLDIWICTKDTDASSSAQADVELGAVALLDELVSGTLDWGSVHWHNKKLSVFGRHYKKPELYPNSFLAANGGSDPWLALGFKGSLEARLIADLPGLMDFKDRYRNEYIHHIFDGTNDLNKVDREAQEYLDSADFNQRVIVGLLAVQLRLQGEIDHMVKQES